MRLMHRDVVCLWINLDNWAKIVIRCTVTGGEAEWRIETEQGRWVDVMRSNW